VRIESPLRKARFVVRDNRFRARVLLGGKEVSAHVPNSGRLTELLLPGREVLVRDARAPHRVTDFDLVMVRLPRVLVSIDARLTNRLFAEALRSGNLNEFAGFGVVRPEVMLGDSRLDFVLRPEGTDEWCAVEVKSVTLVREGIARFPDAATERGKRHLRELRRVRLEGHRAAVVFVIQREDVRLFSPHDESDPGFGEVLREVVQDRVEVYAYKCRVSPEEVTLDSAVPVIL
jgi:sugar fermentation stimulation protein A